MERIWDLVMNDSALYKCTLNNNNNNNNIKWKLPNIFFYFQSVILL